MSLPQCGWCRFYSVSETVQGSNYLVTLMKSSIRIFNLQKPHAALAYMMWIVGLDDMITRVCGKIIYCFLLLHHGQHFFYLFWEIKGNSNFSQINSARIVNWLEFAKVTCITVCKIDKHLYIKTTSLFKKIRFMSFKLLNMMYEKIW